MIDRLREQGDAADTQVAFAARLLQSTSPLEPSLARQQRVRAAMARRKSARAMRFVLRPAVVITLLIGGLAFASAMAVRHRLRSASTEPVGQTHDAPATSAGEAVAAAEAPGAELPPLTAPSREPAAAASEPAAPAAETVTPAPAKARARRSVARLPPASKLDLEALLHPSASSAAPVSLEEESILVSSAMHALRRDRDARRATSLLATYMRRYPDGVLAEEALALAIEAALAQDDPGAIGLAAKYLARFPRGRFGDVARQAQQHFKP